jgi:oxygen-independent coproporphyrinogen-3 oxidase
VTGEPFALYVHVPWCRHVCPYCDFNVYAASRPPEAAYAEALVAELAAHAALAPWSGRPAATVYVGGGTPSLFSPGAIDRLLAAVARAPGLVPGAEVTLEANPATVSRATLAGYRAAGVNRLSLGAESFHPRHLRTLGRDHAPADIAAAVDAARAAGFENVSLDLIYAVPGETLGEWEADLAAAVALEPTHVSTYALTWEVGTPFHTWRASGRLRPVAEDDEAAMATLAGARLEAAGLARYEISSYARPGFASRHNTSYWDGSDYLGLGAGAHSSSRMPFPGRRWTNERRPAAYLDAVGAHGTAVASEERLGVAQARGEFCFTGLRRTAGVDLDAFRRRFGAELTSVFTQVARLVAEGLVEIAEDRLRLTPRGLLFADTVSATFV